MIISFFLLEISALNEHMSNDHCIYFIFIIILIGFEIEFIAVIYFLCMLMFGLVLN